MMQARSILLKDYRYRGSCLFMLVIILHDIIFEHAIVFEHEKIVDARLLSSYLFHDTLNV